MFTPHTYFIFHGDKNEYGKHMQVSYFAHLTHPCAQMDGRKVTNQLAINDPNKKNIMYFLTACIFWLFSFSSTLDHPNSSIVFILSLSRIWHCFMSYFQICLTGFLSNCRCKSCKTKLRSKAMGMPTTFRTFRVLYCNNIMQKRTNCACFTTACKYLYIQHAI